MSKTIYKCPFNPAVECDGEMKCGRCGWNTQNGVDERRRKTNEKKYGNLRISTESEK